MIKRQRKTATSKKVAADMSIGIDPINVFRDPRISGPPPSVVEGCLLLLSIESLSVDELVEKMYAFTIIKFIIFRKLPYISKNIEFKMLSLTDLIFWIDGVDFICLVSETEIAVTCSTLKCGLPVPFFFIASWKRLVSAWNLNMG